MAAGSRYAGFAARAAHSLCAPPADTVGPVADSVTFGRSSIDLNSGSRVQTVTVTASDSSGNGDPSGVSRVLLLVRGNRYYTSPKLTLTSGTPSSGRWTGQFTVSKYAHPGTYSVDYLRVNDAAGNSQSYPGGGTPEGPNALSLHPSDNPTFTVTGTPATRTRKPAGNLSALNLRPAGVDTRSAPRPEHIIARFAGAAPRQVFVEFFSVRKSRSVRFVAVRGVLHRHGSEWAGAARIPRWIGKQTLQAELIAEYGVKYRPSSRFYNSDRLNQLHFPHSVSVVSGVDTTRPTLASLSFSPRSIDSTNGSEQVTVTARAHDVGSGVRYLNVTGGIRHGVNGVAAGSYPFAAAGIGYLSSNDFRVRLKKTSSGAWVGTTTVRQCVPSGKYRLDVTLSDAAGNYRNYSTRQLAAAGLRSTVQVTSKHGDIVPPYVYSAATYGAESEVFLNFSEGVANVNTSTLKIYPLSPRSTRYRTTSDITAITCSDGTHTVDCAGTGGLVTSAKLIVSGMKVGDKYDVFANLDQVTPQLVDGNGNPMDWNYRAAEVMDS